MLIGCNKQEMVDGDNTIVQHDLVVLATTVHTGALAYTYSKKGYIVQRVVEDMIIVPFTIV